MPQSLRRELVSIVHASSWYPPYRFPCVKDERLPAALAQTHAPSYAQNGLKANLSSLGTCENRSRQGCLPLACKRRGMSERSACRHNTALSLTTTIRFVILSDLRSVAGTDVMTAGNSRVLGSGSAAKRRISSASRLCLIPCRFLIHNTQQGLSVQPPRIPRTSRLCCDARASAWPRVAQNDARRDVWLWLNTPQ